MVRPVFRRRTRLEAIEALDVQVVMHVTTVLDERLSPSLLHRPSPLSHQLLYLWYVLKEQVFGPLHTPRDASLRLTFNTPLHA